MHSHVTCKCTRVAAAAEECTKWLRSHRSRRGKPRSRRFVWSRPKAQMTLALSSRRKASLGAHPIISNYDTYICLYYLCIKFRNCLEP